MQAQAAAQPQPQRARRIGIVTAIEGWRLTGAVVTEPAAGRVADTIPQFGALVRIKAPESNLYGLISRIWLREGNNGPAGAVAMFEIEILGEIVESGSASGKFRRGISSYPHVGSEILETAREEIARVYALPGSANVRIGTLHQNPAQPVHVMVDQLLGRHFAVLGTTGSGKSCATALILKAVLDSYPNGHIVIIDPHNEYSRAFGDRAKVLDPTTLRLPYWLLNAEESAAIFCSQDQATREYEMAILREAILKGRREYSGARGTVRANVGHITVDTPVPYFLAEMAGTIEKGLGKLEKPGGAIPYQRLLARIEALKSDERFAFMFSRDPVDDTLADIVGNVLSIPVDRHPLTIIDLSGVPSEIVDVLVSLMCRIIFDFALWSAEHQAAPTLFVCEEAHRYVPRDERLGFEPTRRAIARIAMEGRKYGVSLCLVSNRPSELSPTMLAQCNTIFALRMSNQHDHDFVRSALPEGMSGLVGSLPALRPQEAIAVGEGVSLPLRLRFDDLDEAHRPKSTTAEFSRAWSKTDIGGEFVRDTITRWRHQRRGDQPVPVMKTATGVR
jgi:DNA helicase HerA-like ATPase